MKLFSFAIAKPLLSLGLSICLLSSCGVKEEESEAKSVSMIALLGELSFHTAEVLFDGVIEYFEEGFLDELMGHDVGLSAEESYKAVSRTIGVELKNFQDRQIEVEVNSIIRELERDFAPGTFGHQAHLVDLISRVNKILEVIESQYTNEDSFSSFASGLVPGFQTYQMMSNVLIFLERSKLKSSMKAGADEAALDRLRKGIKLNTKQTYDFLNEVMTVKLPSLIAHQYIDPNLEIISYDSGWMMDTNFVYGYRFEDPYGKSVVLISEQTCYTKEDLVCLDRVHREMEEHLIIFVRDEITRIRTELVGGPDSSFYKYLDILKANSQ